MTRYSAISAYGADRPLQRVSRMVPGRRRLFVVFLLTLAAAATASFWSARAETPAPRPPADSVQATPDTTALPHRVIAYYFHTTQRCVSCRKIEAYTKEAIDAAFAEDLKAGRLVWQVVNVDEKGNEHFVGDYKLYTKSVVLVDEDHGQQKTWKNLAKIWELLADKDGFVRYVQEETRGYLVPKQP